MRLVLACALVLAVALPAAAQGGGGFGGGGFGGGGFGGGGFGYGGGWSHKMSLFEEIILGIIVAILIVPMMLAYIVTSIYLRYSQKANNKWLREPVEPANPDVSLGLGNHHLSGTYQGSSYLNRQEQVMTVDVRVSKSWLNWGLLSVSSSAHHDKWGRFWISGYFNPKNNRIRFAKTYTWRFVPVWYQGQRTKHGFQGQWSLKEWRFSDQGSFNLCLVQPEADERDGLLGDQRV